MIEFEGWIFDFENVDALDIRGHVWSLMRLDNTFYVNYSRTWMHSGHTIGSWQYPFDTRAVRKELFQRYEEWLIEEIILK